MPDETGWYWCKFEKKPWVIVYVDRYSGRLGVSNQDGPIYYLDEMENGFIEFVVAWSGPIEPPNL